MNVRIGPHLEKQLRDIAFIGNTRIDTDTLRDTIDVYEGEAIDAFRISIARNQIENLYRSRNFPYAHVTIDSDALAQVLHLHRGQSVECDFTSEPVWLDQAAWTGETGSWQTVSLEVREFFEPETALISRELARPGELTQGLCSPWQNDYRECSCYYWASARPDFVNVEPNASGASSL